MHSFLSPRFWPLDCRNSGQSILNKASTSTYCPSGKLAKYGQNMSFSIVIRNQSYSDIFDVAKSFA